MEEELPTGHKDSIHDPWSLPRYIENNRRYAESRELTEQQHWESVIDAIEAITGAMHTWQRVYAIGAISGRGVEWAPTRGRPHYHIVGLSCSICRGR